MPTWLDSNGEVAVSTTYTDARGRHYIGGVEVHEAVWAEHMEALDRIATLEGLSRTHLAGCRGANERLRAERDAHLHSYNEALRTVAALARNAGGEVRLPDSALREVEGHVEVSHDYGTNETVIRGK